MNNSLRPYAYNIFDSTMKQTSGRKRRPSQLVVLVLIVLVLGILLTLLNLYQLQQMKEERLLHHETNLAVVEGATGTEARRAPVVWILGNKMETGYLNHVKMVFDRLGFVQTSGDEDWDVLWVHHYPFASMSQVMTRLLPHQKVNHLPGSGYITSKGSLATSVSKAIPTAFKIPADKEKFLKHVKEYPEKLWVQKNNNHRGIKIRHLEDIDFESKGSFVQEFISKPFIIDKRKFDIGLYTIVTSLNPLRIYVIDDEVLVRFCPKDYYPFNEDVVGQYVVGDDYTPMWEIPVLKDNYVNKRYSFKETLNNHLISRGVNVKRLWDDMYETVRTIFAEKRTSLVKSASKYKSSRNFFELVRFDFVLDEDARVYLMEVNMSPNLSTGHFSGNRLLYEHVIYNVLRVTGVASMVHNHFHDQSKETGEMQVSDREIAVFSDWCTQEKCEESCEELRCAVCSYCMSVTEKRTFKDAYLEHVNRGGCRRVTPPAMNQTAALSWNPDKDISQLSTLTETNQRMYIWFVGMCRKDVTFCV